ncbi:hypothetical protein ABK040_008954 [Willaertia magna]
MHQLITRDASEFQRIDLPRCDIKSIKCCGNDIIFILTIDNSIYIYGKDFELKSSGMEKYCQKSNEFKKVNSIEFNNENIKFIESSCEGFIVVTENNDIYVVGLNHNNQFGLEDREIKQFTKLTKFISNQEEIKLIRCSYDCMFVVTNNNIIYGCGENDAGQFGLGHKNKLLTFTKNDCLQQQSIKDLRCGDYHCIILDKFGNVYGCGSNSDLQIIPHKSFLENHNEENNEIKGSILYFTKLNLPYKVKSIRCNAYSSIFLSTVGDVYVIGKIRDKINYLKLNNNIIIRNIISDSYANSRSIYITKNNEFYVQPNFVNSSDESEMIGENCKLDTTEIMTDINMSINLYALDNFGANMYFLLTDYVIDSENERDDRNKLFFNKLKNQLVNKENQLKDITISCN